MLLECLNVMPLQYGVLIHKSRQSPNVPAFRSKVLLNSSDPEHILYGCMDVSLELLSFLEYLEYPSGLTFPVSST